MPTPTSTIEGDYSDHIPDDSSCQLLGPTALVVQGILGVLVILSLVYKRHREPTKRPWRIWLFDVSKQVVGQMFVHTVNVLLSGLISAYTSANACVFYFLHILLDTTFGVGALYVILHALTNLFVNRLQLEGFESGVYGKPPSFKYWARQAALYVLSLTTMKLLVIAILILFPGIFFVGEWLLSWTRIGEGDHLQVIFVMGLFPIMMNIIQFWIIDSIVKAKPASSVSLGDDHSDLHSTRDREPLFQAHSDDEDDGNMYRPSDIENARDAHNRSPPNQTYLSNLAKRSDDDLSIPEDHQSLSNSISSLHSYPPNMTSSTSSNRPISPRPAKNLMRKASKRGGVPAPLNIQHQNPPAVNSPGLIPVQEAVPLAAPTPKRPVSNEMDTWAENWDENDDWESNQAQGGEQGMNTRR